MFIFLVALPESIQRKNNLALMGSQGEATMIPSGFEVFRLVMGIQGLNDFG